MPEVWNYYLDFYKNIFPSYRGYCEKAIDSNIGGVAIFIKNEFQIEQKILILNSQKMLEFKIFGLR